MGVLNIFRKKRTISSEESVALIAISLMNFVSSASTFHKLRLAAYVKDHLEFLKDTDDLDFQKIHYALFVASFRFMKANVISYMEKGLDKTSISTFRHFSKDMFDVFWLESFPPELLVLQTQLDKDIAKIQSSRDERHWSRPALILAWPFVYHIFGVNPCIKYGCFADINGTMKPDFRKKTEDEYDNLFIPLINCCEDYWDAEMLPNHSIELKRCVEESLKKVAF